MTSVENYFKPAMNEIARRTAASRQQTSETTHFQRESGEPCRLPFELPGQSWALITMGTTVLAPRPLDPTRPLLRVYGAFTSREEAVEHSEIVTPLDATCSYVVVPMREWFIMPQTTDVRDDVTVRARRLQERLMQVCSDEKAMADAYEHRLQTQDMRTMQSTNTCEEDAETADAEASVYPAPRRIRRGCEVRQQNFVCLCLHPDAKHGECLVKLLGCFDTVDEADTWCRDVASRTITDVDIRTASMYEWLSMTHGAPNASTHYRASELQRIMDAAERNPQTVRDYKAWKAEQDRLKAEEETEKQTNDALTVDDVEA